MIDARTAMIDSQLRPNRVNDERIIAAISKVDRTLFVPKEKQSIAYVDDSIEVADGRYLLEPRVFARLLVAADIQADELVLDVACGTGYSTAVLAGLADAVVALEKDQTLAEMAEENLTASEVINAAVIAGDVNAGNEKQGPYDVIFIGGAVADVPECFIKQLKDGGRIITLLADKGFCRACKITKNGEKVVRENLFDAHAEILPGFEAKKSFVFDA